MKRFRLLTSLVAIAAIQAIAFAAAPTVPGTDFPFGRFQLNIPPLETPWPGLGNYYSTLSKGVETVMWNPASLSKTKYASVCLSTIMESGTVSYNKKYKTEDVSQDLGGPAGEKIWILFTNDINTTNPATREHTGHANYAVTGTGISYKQGLRVNDWLTLGLVSRGNTGGSLSTTGNFPVVSRMIAEYANNSMTIGNILTISIDNNGFPTLLVTPEGGTTYTQRLDTKIWDGFLHQTSNVPLTMLLEAKNDMSVSAPLTMAGAAQWKDLSVGLSMTPISANCNVSNKARAVVNDGTSDMYFYQPNFDPGSEQSIQNWIQDPNQYGTEAGYKRNTVMIPAGEVIAEARYQGFYQASATRMDFGATYDFGDVLTVGLGVENLNGATLDFRGTGRISYVNSRVSSVEAPPIDPTKEFTWSPFNDTFTTVEGTDKFYLEEQLTAQLPQKMRIGLALRKPFLIALDYEQNQAPIKFKYEDQNTKETKIGVVSNINLIRLGVETQMFVLPWWTRGSIVLMLKPSLANVNKDTQDSVDKYFKYGVIPLGLEFGNEFNLWGVIFGDGFGINATSLLSLAQADTLNLDLSKVTYYDMFVGYGPWRVSYLASFDPAATAAAYGSRPDPSKTGFDAAYVKFIQTLTVSYRF